MGRRGGGRRCVVSGCGRSVRPGQAVCGGHRRTVEGSEAQRAARRMAAADEAARVDEGGEGRDPKGTPAAERFRRRLERGDYRALLDEGVREVMAQGAAERGIAEEMGAIRFAMMRLLAEEEDPVRLSLGVSRLANASARLARVGREFEQDEGLLTEAISQILRELDGEDGRGAGEHGRGAKSTFRNPRGAAVARG